MICSICMKKISDHTVAEAAACSEKFAIVQLERVANQLCCSCGSASDLEDTNGEYWCNGCLMWQTQRNDE